MGGGDMLVCGVCEGASKQVGREVTACVCVGWCMRLQCGSACIVQCG
jgi:hypothetical protein